MYLYYLAILFIIYELLKVMDPETVIDSYDEIDSENPRTGCFLFSINFFYMIWAGLCLIIVEEQYIPYFLLFFCNIIVYNFIHTRNEYWSLKISSTISAIIWICFLVHRFH